MTTVGSDTDDAILQIARTYEVRGMVATIASTDSATQGAGTVLNEVKLEYNHFSQLEAKSQEHAGVVSGSTAKEEYNWDAPSIRRLA